MFFSAATLTLKNVVGSMCPTQRLWWNFPNEPNEANEPKGPKWADEVFTALSDVVFTDDELTESCSSGTYSSDEDAGYSSDEDAGYSSDFDVSVERTLLFVSYESERWFWSPPNSTRIESFGAKYETVSQCTIASGVDRDTYRRSTIYAMPSVDVRTDRVIDSWVDRYGSSKEDVSYVCHCTSDYGGFYIPQL
ncbi:hypothetical protein PsorP6_001612 [Peronosclerospora sorghi]|uniref:Uncharacterized protein n=1 Tax=Peronosclerospora sorghi TaxID=230839 RepID=A0ACC0WZ08_9STRA|nr:hypothetical protein PsorP6_001612 [Peronosclerospora sorghi]